jgi:citrate synthase
MTTNPTPQTVSAPQKPAFVKGLAGVVAAQTAVSHVDGPNSTLIYRGININELAVTAPYEEVAYLILHGVLPTASQLSEFDAQLKANRDIPKSVIDWLRTLHKDTVPMEALRTAISMLSHYEKGIEDISHAATMKKAIRLTAQFPTLCAAYQRLRDGKELIAPNPSLSHAANMLYMLNGEIPDADLVGGMNAYFVLLADHSLNASTFTARVVASTQADLHSSIAAAMAALKGPLHGGANEATMNMLLEIGDPEKVDVWVDNAFVTKRIIMGFGHRIYKNGDPRARVLNKLAEEIGQKVGMAKYYHMSRMVEAAVQRHRELYPNVDFYSASLLYCLGIPIDLFTPMFACSRVIGWSAHVIEQYKDNVLIRPAAEYVGRLGDSYTPVANR